MQSRDLFWGAMLFQMPLQQFLKKMVVAKPLLPIVQRQIYTVQPGNTLGQIAAAYNTTVEAIMEENAKEDTVLTIGQPLVIPPPTTAPTDSPEG